MKWTEQAVFSVLERALGGTDPQAKERAFLRRVRRATGFHEREADAVSCSLWASREDRTKETTCSRTSHP